MQDDSFVMVVAFFGVELWDTQSVSLDEIIVASILLLEEMIETEETQKNGVVLIADMTGLKFRHILQGTPSRILRILSVLQGNYPIKCKGLHSVNEPDWVPKVLSFAKRFFSQKLQERVHFHGSNLESLHNLIPKRSLPTDLGGECDGWMDAIDHKMIQRCFSKEEYYAKWNSMKIKSRSNN